ncbi:amino acid ABC transporter substrate-binding protein (PAAT family) [Synechococcus sp. Ace-Pa]|nr:amino acid ABC transporter substrate-binding protein (PAAT family) [Synechococcus sp. Ace-Pa]
MRETVSSADQNTVSSRSYRLQRFLRGLLLVVVLIVACQTTTTLHAQEKTGPERIVDVGVSLSPPFVMVDDGQYSGLAIELWEDIAKDLNLQSNYRSYQTFRELVDATAASDIDIAVTNLTITKAREERIDFTQPWFDAGLRIMVRADQGVDIRAVIAGLMDSGHFGAYAWLAIIILGATLAVTLFDRRFDPDFPKRWRDGIAESFYTVMSVATSGKPARRKSLTGWLGRIWAAAWLMCGVAVLSYITASVTSVMTMLSLNNQISNLSDLPGKTIGVFSGSTAEDYVREVGMMFQAFPSIESAVASLRKKDVAAIVADAPVLEYYQHNNPNSAVEVVGPIFEPDKYGFALNPGNPLTEAVTLELLEGKENDLIEKLRADYFGR